MSQFKFDVGYYNTKHFFFNGNNRCSYCGRECRKFTDWDDRECDVYWNCFCPKAMKELELKKKIDVLRDKITELERDFPEENKDLMNDMMYECELKQLKKKYGKENE